MSSYSRLTGCCWQPPARLHGVGKWGFVPISLSWSGKPPWHGNMGPFWPAGLDSADASFAPYQDPPVGGQYSWDQEGAGAAFSLHSGSRRHATQRCYSTIPQPPSVPPVQGHPGLWNPHVLHTSLTEPHLIFLLLHLHTSSFSKQDYFLPRGKKDDTLCHVQGSPFSLITLLSVGTGEAEEHRTGRQNLRLSTWHELQLTVWLCSGPLTSLGSTVPWG